VVELRWLVRRKKKLGEESVWEHYARRWFVVVSGP
jgi:hypothetical protein